LKYQEMKLIELRLVMDLKKPQRNMRSQSNERLRLTKISWQ
jgi:hypothetical protein